MQGKSKNIHVMATLGRGSRAAELASQKFTRRICGNDWWETCHSWGPGITAPLRHAQKLLDSQHKLSVKLDRAGLFWRESLLLKVITLRSQCERKIWCIYKRVQGLGAEALTCGWARWSGLPLIHVHLGCFVFCSTYTRAFSLPGCFFLW